MMLAKLLVTTFLCWSSGQSGSMVTSTADVYAKCTENEERFCQKGSDQFHHCTAVSINTIKPSLESPQTPKIVCECQGGFTTPFLQAYEEAFVPTQQCIPCQEERTVYHGSDLKVILKLFRNPYFSRILIRKPVSIYTHPYNRVLSGSPSWTLKQSFWVSNDEIKRTFETSFHNPIRFSVLTVFIHCAIHLRLWHFGRSRVGCQGHMTFTTDTAHKKIAQLVLKSYLNIFMESVFNSSSFEMFILTQHKAFMWFFIY